MRSLNSQQNSFFGMDFDFLKESPFLGGVNNIGTFIPVSGFFLLLDGTNFELLDGTNFELL